MKKLLHTLIIVVVVLLLIGGYVFSSRSPYIAIRKHLMMIDPVQAVTCDIQPTAIVDFEKGRPFIINGFGEYQGGFVENKTGHKIYNVYVKSNEIGLYYVYSMAEGF